MSPAIVSMLVELGIELAPTVKDLLTGIFDRNPQEEKLAQLALERLVGDKRAAAKFGPLPPSDA